MFECSLQSSPFSKIKFKPCPEMKDSEEKKCVSSNPRLFIIIMTADLTSRRLNPLAGKFLAFKKHRKTKISFWKNKIIVPFIVPCARLKSSETNGEIAKIEKCE